MKILKLLNKKFFFIFLTYLLFLNPIKAEDNPIDIWNLEKKENETVKETVITGSENNNDQISVFDMQSDKNTGSIELDENLISKEVKIVGLYDPEEHGLTIDMWTNSDGQKLKSLFDSLEKINLSNDALEIMEVSLLTNAHYPNQNITENEFLKFKSDWLIKNSNLEQSDYLNNLLFKELSIIIIGFIFSIYVTYYTFFTYKKFLTNVTLKGLIAFMYGRHVRCKIAFYTK